jgi:hypothetical protein
MEMGEQSGDFRFLAAIFGVRGDNQRVAMRPQDGAWPL